MSEPIPESIPTSADPRSKRPLKKRALSPRSQVASQISSLFAKPENEIKLVMSTPLAPAPPEIVQNVQGSSAGAGSGEFHVYKASRRREYERLRGMEEEVERDKGNLEWETERIAREQRDRDVTRKKRLKRERLKSRSKSKKAGNGTSAEKQEGAGKIKARPDAREDIEGQDSETSPAANVVQEVGVVIHDDD